MVQRVKPEALRSVDSRSRQLRTEKSISKRRDPNLAPALNQIGLLHAAERGTSDAEREFRVAIQQNPQFAEAKNNLGVVYAERRDFADAEGTFRVMIENDFSYVQAYENPGKQHSKELLGSNR